MSRDTEWRQNFRRAGIWDYIDARLADSHELLPKLDGQFGFVFCDAETEWYKNYFDAVPPKLVPVALLHKR